MLRYLLFLIHTPNIRNIHLPTYALQLTPPSPLHVTQGKRLSDPCPESAPTSALLSALQQLNDWVDDHPPSSQALRYGNPAFRDWFDHMASAAPDLLRPVLPTPLQPAVVELTPYLVHSFGNRTRIDYGTGHETTFVALLYCLAVLGVVAEDDCQALVTRVFAAYLKLMRKVQTTYWCVVLHTALERACVRVCVRVCLQKHPLIF